MSSRISGFIRSAGQFTNLFHSFFGRSGTCAALTADQIADPCECVCKEQTDSAPAFPANNIIPDFPDAVPNALQPGYNRRVLSLIQFEAAIIILLFRCELAYNPAPGVLAKAAYRFPDGSCGSHNCGVPEGFDAFPDTLQPGDYRSLSVQFKAAFIVLLFCRKLSSNPPPCITEEAGYAAFLQP